MVMPTGDLVQSEERRRLNVVSVIGEIEKILDLDNQTLKDAEYQAPIKRYAMDSMENKRTQSGVDFTNILQAPFFASSFMLIFLSHRKGWT